MNLFQNKLKIQEELSRKFALCDRWITIISSSKDELMNLLQIHKNMWKEGLRCPNIGPDTYGMFRTDDIETMAADEVYLGGINGLFTCSVEQWEAARQKDIGQMRAEGRRSVNPDYYTIVCRQYRNFLLDNIRAMKAVIYDNSFSRVSFNKNIVEGFNIYQNWAKPFDGDILGVNISNACICDNMILRCMLWDSEKKTDSSFLFLNEDIFVPTCFHEGVRLTPTTLGDYKYINIKEVIDRKIPIRTIFFYEFRPKTKISVGGDWNTPTRKEAILCRKRVAAYEKQGFCYGRFN